MYGWCWWLLGPSMLALSHPLYISYWSWPGVLELGCLDSQWWQIWPSPSHFWRYPWWQSFTSSWGSMDLAVFGIVCVSDLVGGCWFNGCGHLGWQVSLPDRYVAFQVSLLTLFTYSHSRPFVTFPMVCGSLKMIAICCLFSPLWIWWCPGADVMHAEGFIPTIAPSCWTFRDRCFGIGCFWPVNW